MLALNIDAVTSAQHWSYLPGDGASSRSGEVRFPIRACYPQVALRDRAAHVLAIGDIVEPNEAWRAHKKETTGSAWDYVFRRLFYAHSPDIGREGFAPPIEVDSVEATGGHIRNLDLWLDPRGIAHLLYLKTNISGALRDRFFPGRKIVTTLEHAEVERGRVIRRTTLSTGGEGEAETPSFARFHATADGTLLVVSTVGGSKPDGSPVLENRLIRVSPRPETEHSGSPGPGRAVHDVLHRRRARGEPRLGCPGPLRHRRGIPPPCAMPGSACGEAHHEAPRKVRAPGDHPSPWKTSLDLMNPWILLGEVGATSRDCESSPNPVRRPDATSGDSRGTR